VGVESPLQCPCRSNAGANQKGDAGIENTINGQDGAVTASLVPGEFALSEAEMKETI